MNSSKRHILLITPTQPTLNPRLVKEADALSEVGFDVKVIYQYWNQWGTVSDEQLLKTKKWKAIRVGGDPVNEKLNYHLSRGIHKAAKVIFTKTQSKAAAIGSIARGSYHLIKAAKEIEADLYIGHNLGALPATVIAANYNNKKCGFDAEDFHRFERNDDPNHTDVKLRKYIEDQFFDDLCYLTTASPLISKQYSSLYPNLKVNTILNVFPKRAKNVNINVSKSDPLKLFWFSQTIGTDRGIQDIIKAMKLLEDKEIELHLYGYLPELSKTEFNKLIKELEFRYIPNINYHAPVSPDDLLEIAQNFDIGFAIEPGFCFNNKIALSNKLFTYLFGGNAIIFSNTPGQTHFYQMHKTIGQIYNPNDVEALAALIMKYDNERTFLLEHRMNSRKLFEEEMNWDLESKKFIEIVESSMK